MSIDRCGGLIRKLLLTFSLVALLWLLLIPKRLALLRLVLFLEDFILASELILVVPSGCLSLMGIDVDERKCKIYSRLDFLNRNAASGPLFNVQCISVSKNINS